jgi:hypothetical protein
MKTIEQIVDRAGDWNPQIFRELKERLNPRNLSLAGIGSLLVQGLIWMSYDGQIPAPMYDIHEKLIPTYSRYCETAQASNTYHNGNCILDGSKYLIKWDLWWSDLYVQLGLFIALGTILGVVYTLVADLSKEEKRGTLNFIRLSPQSPQNIFLGKLLGVPILVYLAAALAIPLHLWAGLHAGTGFGLLAAGELTILAMVWFWGSAAILYSLLGGFQAILTTLAIAYFASMPIMLVNYFTSSTLAGEEWLKSSKFSWFFLPIFSHAIWLDLFISGCCAIAGILFWQAICRRYLNPSATIITKTESYISTVLLQVWLLGFVLPLINAPYYDRNGVFITAATADFIVLAFLIPLLLPSKQAMQDWSRFRRQRVNSKGQLSQSNLLGDLLFNDRAPALLTIAINLSISAMMWSVLFAIVQSTKMSELTRLMACVSIATCMLLIYTAIVHLIQFFNLKKRNVWMVGAISVSMLLPMVLSLVLSGGGNNPKGIAAIVMLFSPLFPWAVANLPGITILATCIAQMGIFIGLTAVLQRKLKIAGASESKAALAG